MDAEPQSSPALVPALESPPALALALAPPPAPMPVPEPSAEPVPELSPAPATEAETSSQLPLQLEDGSAVALSSLQEQTTAAATAADVVDGSTDTTKEEPAAAAAAEDASDSRRQRRQRLKSVKYVEDDGSDDDEQAANEKKRKARTLDYQLRPAVAGATYPDLDLIVGRRINKRSGSVEYLCKFVGRSYLHLWWLTFDELELFVPAGYQKQHRVQLFDRKLRREGYQDTDDVDDLEANKVTVEKILSHRVDPRDKLDDQIERRRQELPFTPQYPRVSDYFLLSNADVLPERMGGMVQKLLNESGGEVFEHPVDTDETPDYLNVISNPMDFGTIASRVARETYYIGPAAVALFVSDVRLVFANCKEFNAAGSEIWAVANELSKTFEKWVYEWLLSPTAWLRLAPTGDLDADKALSDAFRDAAEDSYDLWSPWEPGCAICRKNDNSDQLLLCDRCDGEIHMYCSTPEITELPTDEWYCTYCEHRNAFEARVRDAPKLEDVAAADSAAAASALDPSVSESTVGATGSDRKPVASPKSVVVAVAATPAVPSILCEAVLDEDKKYNRKAPAKLANSISNTPMSDRATFFLVKWVGMSIKYSTWERPEDIGDDEQLQRYFKFSRVPSEKEILETTCQLPCCAKRNPYLLNIAAHKSCTKDKFCTLGWCHDGDCSRELKALGQPYGSAAYRKLRMVEQVKAQLYAFHCLLNNHTPDRDVLKQCGVFANAYVSKRQHLTSAAANKPVKDEEDEDYSDGGGDSSDDDDEVTPFRPMYPGLIDEVDDSDDALSAKKKPEDEVADVVSSLVEHIALGYPTQLAHTPKRVRYNSKFAPTSFPGVTAFSEFCVALRRTPLGLGLRLGATAHNCVSVLGFQPLPRGGGIGPAEASRVITPGDVLVGVNNHAVGGFAFKDVVQVIARSPDLILFHFHSRRSAFVYPPYSQAKHVVVHIDPVREHTVPRSEYAPFSYATYQPVLKVGSATGSSSASSSAARAAALVSQSNYISPNGPMQHLYTGVIDNSIDPHEHFASFLPAKQRRLAASGDKTGRDAKHEFIPYEQSPTYKGGRTLRQYQVEGLNWMISSFKAQRSSILADEMGLGKTVQVVSFIEHLRTEESIRGPYLIVVPLSTIQHWRREIESWTDLNVCVYHDVGDRANHFTAKDMRAILREQEWYYTGMGNTIFKFNILLTTFETLLADFEELETIHWRLVVVDEAHRLKSSGSRVLKQMRAFQCDRKLLLTGTPLQNNIQELWVLLNYLEPVKFDSMDDFNARFGKLISQEQVQELQQLLGPYILRRVKEDVEKSIPPKEETIIAVELTTLQKQYYRAIYDKNKSFLYRGTKNGLPTLNNIQLQLRMCCNHPFLIKGVEDRELEELGSKPSPEDVMNKVVQCSGKMVLVSKLLPKLKREGHKVLIFSQFLKQLDMLERYCEFHGFGYERLDGSTGGSMRQSAIDRFSRPNSKSTVFLLSTKAGGVGINLIAADTVIIFDSDWNPMNDLQAQSRCHRIGQKKLVQIYRLVTRNTYESEMFDRASRKLGLEHAILGTASFSETAQVEKPSSELLVELLKRGAYALMEDDDTASKEFADRDIETILKENAHVRVMAQGTGDVPDSDAPATRKSPTKKRVRKSLGGMAVDRSSFVAEGSTGELAVDDPNFWEKVLPGAVSVEMLSMKLEDGSAVSSRQSKIKFISNLDIALNELVTEMKSAATDEGSRFGANLAHEYDIAIQILHAVTTKYRHEFSTEQLDLVRGYLSKLEKSRVRSCRVVPTKRESEGSGNSPAGKKRRPKGSSSAAIYGLDSDDDGASGDDDDGDDGEADGSRGPSRKKTKRNGNGSARKDPKTALFSSNKAKRSYKKKSGGAAVPTPVLFEGGVINDSDDLCTLCGDGGLILLCDGPCHRSFHLECIGMDVEPDDDRWLCPDCAAGRHMCLLCKQVGEMGVEFGVLQCSMAKCGRFYHKGCLMKDPHVEWVGKKRFRCPSHVCHGCTSGSDAKKRASTKKLAPAAVDANIVSCIHCAQAFHVQCMAASGKFVRLSTNLMICATHLRDKKAPSAAGSTSNTVNGDVAAAVGGTSDRNATSSSSAAAGAKTNALNGAAASDASATIALHGAADDDDSAASSKRKRVSVPAVMICGFCHKGDVTNSSADAASATKSQRSKRAKSSKQSAPTRTTDDSIEGAFVDAPVRLQLPNKTFEMVFVHLNCALHSAEVYVKTNGVFCNLPRALKRGRQLKCVTCRASGATVGCVVDKCRFNAHLRCAIESGGEFIGSPYTLYCKDHAAAKHAERATQCVCGAEDARDKTLALQCATCRVKFHPKCVNVSGRQATRLRKSHWVCTACSGVKASAVKPSTKVRASAAAAAAVESLVAESEEEEEEEEEEEVIEDEDDDEHAMIPVVIEPTIVVDESLSSEDVPAPKRMRRRKPETPSRITIPEQYDNDDDDNVDNAVKDDAPSPSQAIANALTPQLVKTRSRKQPPVRRAATRATTVPSISPHEDPAASNSDSASE